MRPPELRGAVELEFEKKISSAEFKAEFVYTCIRRRRRDA
jgi:hypothetical protein